MKQDDMPDRAHTLDITPEILTLGDRIVAVRQIATVTGGRTRPFRWPGIALILTAILMLAYVSVFDGGLATIKSGGSTLIWLALIAAGLGIFGQVFQRRQILVATADGGKLRLSAGRDDFVRQVVVRVGEAIRAKPGATLHYIVNLKAETIEIRAVVEAPAAAAALVPQAMPQQLPVNLPLSTPTPIAAQLPPFTPSVVAQQGERPDAPWSNGGPAYGSVPAAANGRAPAQNGWMPHAGVGASPNGGSPGHMQAGPANGGYGNGGYGNSGASVSNGAYANGGGSGAPVYRNGLSTQPPTGPPGQVRREIEAVVAFVVRSDIQHKQALLDLLNVVEDHFNGGQTSRDDAISNWHSFAGYVEQYLGNVDGLIGITHRAGRSLMHG